MCRYVQIIAILLLLLVLPPHARSTICSGGNEFYPEVVGKVKVPVEKGI